MIRIALAGNPNSGKTTLFNSLSGCNERVGNWAGVTVSKKESPLRRRYNPLQESIMLVDLPGAYGMNAYTNDELEATEFLRNENIDVIINVVDAANLERSLHLTEELIATKIPVVIALNKVDIIRKKNTVIDIEKLSELLRSPVHFTQATSKRGLKCVLASAIHSIDRRGEYADGFKRKEQKNKKHRRFGAGKGRQCHNYN